jgi:hypothetical protein
MNTVEQIYQDIVDFPEPLALEVLHFVEFLKTKKMINMPNKTTVAAITAGERGEYEAVTLDDLQKQWEEA